jgi:hypothetical protein
VLSVHDNMKRVAAIVMASLVAMVCVGQERTQESLTRDFFGSLPPDTHLFDQAIAQARANTPDIVPIGTARSASLPPEARKTLVNNEIKVVTQLQLERGKWVIAGGSTIQLTAVPGCGEVCGHYLYTYAAFVKGDPNSLPLKADTGLWAAPYGTYWVAADPKSGHVIFIEPASQTVYLTVKYYGQVPAQLAQVFGSITAVKVADL